MDDKEKAEQRFKQTAEEIKVTFVPQCNSCEKNLGLADCTEFHPKPIQYRINKDVCPKRSLEK